MKFKGMNRDVHPDELPDGYWKDASNMVYNSRRQRLENEEGISVFNADTITADILGIIPLNEGVIKFTLDSVTGVGGIYHISSIGIATPIVVTTELNFDLDNPIKGDFHYNYKNELVIVFWEGLADSANKPRMLNMDCLPFDVDGNGAPLLANKIYLLDQFTNVDDLEVGLGAVTTSGSLESGVYFPFVGYGYKDGSSSEYFATGGPIYIHGGDATDIFTQVHGDEGGTATNKAIELALSNINTDYYFINVAFVKQNGGVRTAVELEPVVITGATMTVIYDGAGPGVTASTVAEVTTPMAKFERVQAGAVHLNNRLHYLNVKTIAPPDIQAHVNDATVAWVRTLDVQLSTFTNSYKDPVFLFDKKGFKAGEVYAFYLIVTMLNGDKYAYHIPGRAPSTVLFNGNPHAEDATVQSVITAGDGGADHAEAILVDANSKIYQLFNTATSGGTMGFWQNEDEVYPSVDCFDIKDAGGNVTGTLQGEKVRHHKFPELAALDGWANLFVDNVGTINEESMACTNFDGTAGVWNQTLPAPPVIAVTGQATMVEVSHGGGVWSGGGNSRYTADYDQEVLIDVVWDLVSHPSPVTYNIKHGRIINGTYFEVEELYNVTNAAGTYADIFAKALTIQKDDILDFNFYSIGGGGPTTASSTIHVKIWSNTLEDSACTSKVMGLSVSNLHIPAAVQPDIAYMTIGFAKRTGTNITRPAQHVMEQSEYAEWDSGSSSTTRKRSHPFDTLYYKTGINYDYIKGNNIYLSDRVDVAGNQVAHPVIFSNGTPWDNIMAIESTHLQPENIGIPADNKGREEVFIFDLYSGILTLPFNYPHIDFGVYKTNMYLNLFEQQVIESVNYKFTPAAATSGTVYGGDTVISIQGTIITNPATSIFTGDIGDNNTNKLTREPHRMFLIPVESIVNIGLRHDNDPLVRLYFPHDAWLDEAYWTEDPDVPGDGLPMVEFSESYEYNTDYSALLDLIPAQIVECVSVCAHIFDFNWLFADIYRSQSTATANFTENWRKFPVNDSYSMPKNKGQGWRLVSYNKVLYIQHTYALFVAKTKDTLLSSTVEVSLGKGDLFTTDPDEVLSDSGGVIGNRHYWAAFAFEGGYVVVDDSTKNKTKIYLVGANGVEEISANGMQEYFFRHGHINNIYEDDPVDGRAWLGAYDKKHNRLVFTRRDPNGTNNGEDGAIPIRPANMTLSYNLDEKFWVGFHTYIPNFLFHTRRGLMSARNDMEGAAIANRIFVHNEGTYGYYYNTRALHTAHPSYADIIISDPNGLRKQFESLELDTTFTDFSRTAQDEAVTQIMVYNDTQNSGVIELDHSTTLTSKTNRIKNVLGIWQFSGFRDIVVNTIIAHITDGTDAINSANLDANRAWFKKNRFVGQHIVVRVQYDNVTLYRFLLKDVKALLNKSNRLP